MGTLLNVVHHIVWCSPLDCTFTVACFNMGFANNAALDTSHAHGSSAGVLRATRYLRLSHQRRRVKRRLHLDKVANLTFADSVAAVMWHKAEEFAMRWVKNRFYLSMAAAAARTSICVSMDSVSFVKRFRRRPEG